MQFDRTARRTQELNLTALVDVFFQLIIFFMLTTSFIQIDAIDMMLPSDTAQPETTVTPPPPANGDVLDSLNLVDIASSGTLYLNRKEISQEDLQSTLQAKLRTHPELEILVRTAKDVNVQKLVDVMDVIHVAGGRKIAVDEWDGVVPLEHASVPNEPASFNPFSENGAAALHLSEPEAAPANTSAALAAAATATAAPPTTTATEEPAAKKTKSYTLSPRAQAAREKMYQPPAGAPVNSPLQRLRQQLEHQ